MKELPLNMGKSYGIIEGYPERAAGVQKGEDNMRKYGHGGRLETVICNGCGKRLVVEDGIVREGVLSIDHAWDFFSEKDGEVHHLDLCEACCDRIAGEFKIPVEIEEQTELL